MNIELTVPELMVPEAVSKRLDKLINFFAGLNLSIRAKILISFLVVIFLLIAVNTMMILNVLRFNRQYDVIITNVGFVQSEHKVVKTSKKCIL
jgi:hypothetical protein